MASKSEVLRRAPVCVRWAIHPGARASRPHPYTCKQPPIQGHSLARRTKPAFTGISSIVPSFVRARRPRSQVGLVRARRPRSRVVFMRAGRPRSRVVFVRARRPRSRVGFVRAGRPRSQVVFTPSPPPRPLVDPSRASSNPLVALRRSSWPFVDNLFAFLWISYVSWLCSSATISRATSRARSGWPGGREMAATTGWPPPP